jgi:hypothetical protein
MDEADDGIHEGHHAAATAIQRSYRTTLSRRSSRAPLSSDLGTAVAIDENTELPDLQEITERGDDDDLEAGIAEEEKTEYGMLSSTGAGLVAGIAGVAVAKTVLQSLFSGPVLNEDDIIAAAVGITKGIGAGAGGGGGAAVGAGGGNATVQ